MTDATSLPPASVSAADAVADRSPEEPPAPEVPTPTPAPTGGGRHAAPKRNKSSGLRSAIEWLVIVAVALLGALLIRTVLFQAFFIPSPSMTPTLKVHDRILVNKLSYDVHPVHRGDIVVFRRSSNMANAEGSIRDLVKRVIGLPGETVQSTADGRIEINGQLIDESYLPRGIAPGPPVKVQVIPPGHYWVMGDNRSNSADSRFFGPIAKSQIIGRVFVLIWPLNDFHLFG